MKPRVLICVLCGPEREQWIVPPLAMRLIEAARLPNVEVRTVFGVYGYAAARNRAAEVFLETDADWLCMCDNDTVPPADFVPRALLCQGDIVALPYYIRPTLDNPGNSLLCVGWHHATEADFFTLPTQMEGGWREVDVAGAGCMFVRRSVFSRLAAPYFSIPDHAARKNLTGGPSEDFDFCERARAAGCTVWTNADLLCGHLHTVDLAAVARATGARAQEDLEILRRLGMPTVRTVQKAAL